MTAHSILKKAVDLGVKLIAVDGRIKGRGPKPDPAFLAVLRAHEGEIVALLSASPEPDPVEPEDTKAAALGGEPGFWGPCAARAGRVEEVDGMLLHFCAECGAWGSFGSARSPSPASTGTSIKIRWPNAENTNWTKRR